MGYEDIILGGGVTVAPQAIEKVGPGEYKVASASRPGVAHTVRAVLNDHGGGARLECSCEGFRHRGYCRHRDAVSLQRVRTADYSIVPNEGTRLLDALDAAFDALKGKLTAAATARRALMDAEAQHRAAKTAVALACDEYDLAVAEFDSARLDYAEHLEDGGAA